MQNTSTRSLGPPFTRKKWHARKLVIYDELLRKITTTIDPKQKCFWMEKLLLKRRIWITFVCTFVRYGKELFKLFKSFLERYLCHIVIFFYKMLYYLKREGWAKIKFLVFFFSKVDLCENVYFVKELLKSLL